MFRACQPALKKAISSRGYAEAPDSTARIGEHFIGSDVLLEVRPTITADRLGLMSWQPDRESQRALLKLLSDKFDRTPLQGGQTPPQGGSLGLEDQAFDFNAAVVLFSEIDAKLPAVIRGESPA